MNGAAGTYSAINAKKASGVVVRVNEDAFFSILKRSDSPLVVHAEGWLSRTKHKYLTSYKGLAFYTTAREPLPLPGTVETVEADSIWIPDL